MPHADASFTGMRHLAVGTEAPAFAIGDKKQNLGAARDTIHDTFRIVGMGAAKSSRGAKKYRNFFVDVT
jgi:hypothetical protein